MNRRGMEVVVVTVILLHPVIKLGKVWAAKHLATSGNPVTGVIAKTVTALA
jgi:hypothetical protein